MSFSATDHEYMAEALRLARRGLYSTSPNPRVGCLIVKQDRVIGRGWHERAGQQHAEIIALTEAGGDARGASAYVTLEPCAHQGRTGACAKALIEAGIDRVVVSGIDPFPAVSGQGVEIMKAAGIRVDTGLLGSQAQWLNRGFFSRFERQRPWLRVKLAASLDGRTALEDGASQWITGSAARQDVHRWRARSCAILTGIGTMLFDRPGLDVRLAGDFRQPLRVIADSNWQTPADAPMLQSGAAVLVGGLANATVPEGLANSNAELIKLPATPDGRIKLPALLQQLAEREVNEIQVEAGPTLAGGLLQAGLVDELLLYMAPKLIGDPARGLFNIGPLTGIDQCPEFSLLDSRMIGPDLRLQLRPAKQGES